MERVNRVEFLCSPLQDTSLPQIFFIFSSTLLDLNPNSLLSHTPSSPTSSFTLPPEPPHKKTLIPSLFYYSLATNKHNSSRKDILATIRFSVAISLTFPIQTLNFQSISREEQSNKNG